MGSWEYNATAPNITPIEPHTLNTATTRSLPPPICKQMQTLGKQHKYYILVECIC